ncbi:hypothetical protein FSHL1_000018 [Fusarium sambucinum]
MVRAALDADYSAHDVFLNDSLRLVTEIVNITEEFSGNFEACSYAYAFGEDLSADAQLSSHGALADDASGPFSAQFSVPVSPVLSLELQSHHTVFDSERVRDDDGTTTDPNSLDANMYPDLEGVLTRDLTIHKPAGGIMLWIAEMYRRSRGVGLGTFGPRILSSVFREQSANWQRMTRQYLSRVILAVHRFILGALEGACTERRVRDELVSGIMDELFDRYYTSLDHAMYLVDVERQKKPYTLNHYFNNNPQKACGNRICYALKGKAWTERGNPRLIVTVDDVSSIVSNESIAEQTTEDIHDILQAYYKVARKRFVDNVYHQTVDHRLLSGPSNPLSLFCEQWVLQLEADKLRIIAGESRATRDRYSSLGKTLEDLEAAMVILG